MIFKIYLTLANSWFSYFKLFITSDPIMKKLALLLLLIPFLSVAQIEDRHTLVKRKLTTPEHEFFQNVAFQTTMQSGKVIYYHPDLRTIHIILESNKYTFLSHISITVRNGFAYAKGVVDNRGWFQNSTTVSITISDKHVGVGKKAYEELEKFMDNIVPKAMATDAQKEILRTIANSGNYTEIEQEQILQQLDKLTFEKADRLIEKLRK